MRTLRLTAILGVFSLAASCGDQVAPPDGPRPAWTTSRIAGTPTPPEPYAIRPAFPGLSFKLPTSLTELPGGRWMVTEIGGRILTFPDNAAAKNADLLINLGDTRLFHATLHPKFEANRRLFACYARGKTTYLSQFLVAGSPPKADPGSETVLLTWPSGGHNGGCLAFGTDGKLYISTGDGSGPNPPDGLTAGQDVSNLFGCVLRIDVDRKDTGKNYAVPPDNPFVGRANTQPEIWSYGLRNPWKFGIDRMTGNVFLADNGWETWESVHQIVRGGNCGWPIMEGRAILRSEVQPGPTPIRPAVKDHHHSEANSVIGGPVYRGKKLADLDATFIYGDYITGTIWGLKTDGADGYEHRTLVDTDQRIVAFAESSAGDVLVVDYDFTGQIYRLVPSNVEDRSASFPRRLSETGLFASVDDLIPAPGVVPYDVVVRRWTDGAEAQRWVAIPGNGTVTLGEGEAAPKYPEGTVFAKHLTLPAKETGGRPIRLETQVLHYEGGVWRPYSYLWDEEGGDARLVDSIGADRELTTANGVRTWHVSALNECRLCHNPGSGVVIGFEPRQLDRPDQLALLAEVGAITRAPRPGGRLVSPHDASQKLDDRARSYLHGNCGSCHHPGGNAIVSFYLNRGLPFDQLRTNKGTGIGTFGLQDARIIAPGDPYRSILLYRMSKLGYARMPYIGSRRVDSRGVALIEEWIRSMPRPAGAPAPISADAGSATRLLGSSPGALAVAIGIHGGRIDAKHARAGYASSKTDVRGLFETFIPEGKRRKTLGRTIDPQTILSLDGKADRGRLIFYSDGARCRACHDESDAAKSTGPTLAEIRKKYPRRNEMLQHIINPSLQVEEKFATWVVRTTSGNIHDGVLLSQDDREVVLRTAQRKTIRIPRSRVDRMRKSTQSLMPTGILGDLTAQEAADLLAWLGTGKK